MTKYKNDPTEDFDFEPSACDNFWLSQDEQTDEAKEYVNELEKKIKDAKDALKELYDLARQMEMTYYENKINQIINNLK
jgi:coenzyme F420-reducing hydrogenase alpha subunit